MRQHPGIRSNPARTEARGGVPSNILSSRFSYANSRMWGAVSFQRSIAKYELPRTKPSPDRVAAGFVEKQLALFLVAIAWINRIPRILDAIGER